MLRSTCTDLPVKISIITNFGCPHKCWYCIWKGHPLEHVNDTTDWNKLYDFLKQNKDQGKFSVSGGGDCLHLYNRYEDWWKKLFEIANELDMMVDVHSRTKFYDSYFWRKINRCVFSSDILDLDIDYLKYLVLRTKVRITHLVTAVTTSNMIDEYLDFCNKYGCQFTIKQLIGYDDGGKYNRIRNRYPNIFNLDAGDYNIYYMPDNNVYDKFLLGE